MMKMALPEKRNELNRIDEQTALNRLDEQDGRWENRERIEEHYRAEDEQYRDQRAKSEHRHNGHRFGKDVHPERYPRESLSRLEDGILEDDELRHKDDHLGSTIPDLEHRIDDVRSLSRTLMVSGGLLLIFAWILAWWVGWDVRSGNVFFSTMWIVGVIIGLGLIVWGTVEQQRIARLLRRMPGVKRGERIRSDVREGDRAA